MSLSYAIIGTGAIGGFYGGKLARAGIDVHFLSRSDTEYIRRHGLRVDSKDGDFHLPHVNVYGNAADMPRCDVAVICLKATQNAALAHILPRLLAPQGTALLLQNGLGGEELVASIAGPERVIGALAFVCTSKVGPGHIHHVDYGNLKFGQYTVDGSPGGVTRRMKEIAADFLRAGVSPVECVEHLALARWQKLMWNIPFNGLTILLNATTRQIMDDSGVRELARAIMQEIMDGALACGIAIPREFIGAMIDYTQRMAPYRPSMKLDFDARRPMEVDAIFGEPVRRMRRAGFAAPVIESMHRMLEFLDKQRLR